MKFLLLVGAWFLVIYFANLIMMAFTNMLAGPQNFDHIGYTIIMTMINVKIFMIMDKHIIFTNKE